MINMIYKIGQKGKHLSTGRIVEISKINNGEVTLNYKNELGKMKSMVVKEKYLQSDFKFEEPVETLFRPNIKTGQPEEVVTFIPKFYDSKNDISYTPMLPFFKSLTDSYTEYAEITTYSNKTSCIEYLFRYGFINALTSMLAFKKLFSIKKDIKNILIIGGDNKLDWLGLRLMDRSLNHKIFVTNLDKTKWAKSAYVIPSEKIEKNPSLQINIKSPEFLKLNFEKYDLILFSRVLNYKESTKIPDKYLEKVFDKAHQGAIIADISHMENQNCSFFEYYTKQKLNVYDLASSDIEESPLFKRFRDKLWSIYKNGHKCDPLCQGIENKIFYCNNCPIRIWNGMPQTSFQSFATKRVYNRLRAVMKTDDKIVDIL